MSRLFILAAIFPVLTMGPVFADSTPIKDAVPHITTSGSASVEIVPDQASIMLGITQENADATAAAAATAKAASEVIAEIKAQGIDAKDIKTTFNLSARYDEDRDEKGRLRRTPRGYLSVETVTIRLHDVSKAGPLARDLIAKGANDFQGIFFSYSKETETRQRLKADAIRDAKAEAKTYTDAIGVKLGRTLQIGDDGMRGNEASLPARRNGASVKSAVVIPTEPGVQEIQETISVVWEIEGKRH